MCTAATLNGQHFYFGRNLDSDIDFSQSVVLTPRGYKFKFRHAPAPQKGLALIGAAIINADYPLYFEAANECGLCMAGLNFVGNAFYADRAAASRGAEDNKIYCAQYEFLPLVLGSCKNLFNAEQLIKKVVITDEDFSAAMPSAQLHWLIADKSGARVIEYTRHGLKIYNCTAGVLTNNPPFDEQMNNLARYMSLSPREPENNFAADLCLKADSLGAGAFGLPGDYTSASRFVRAAFVRNNIITEGDGAADLFRILDSVSFQRGCCRGANGWEITQYSCCIDADSGVYFYKTYGKIAGAADMRAQNLEGCRLVDLSPQMRKNFFFA